MYSHRNPNLAVNCGAFTQLSILYYHAIYMCLDPFDAFFSAQLTLGAISFKSLYKQEANVTIWN